MVHFEFDDLRVELQLQHSLILLDIVNGNYPLLLPLVFLLKFSLLVQKRLSIDPAL